MKKCFFVLMGVVVLGCGGVLQSYGAGLQVICDGPNTCKECGNAGGEMKMQLLARHISDQLYNPSAVEVMEATAIASTEMRGQLLASEAKANGIQSCALAELWDAEYLAGWQRNVATLCGIPDDCADFDASATGTIDLCIDATDLPWEVKDAITAMDATSPKTLGAGVRALAAKHGQPNCALAMALDGAQ